ncbi:hypothetical protein Forpe1208_v010999 [Fusarium oxysporum f. sp. rapae]|uniref:Uncharacterized protein n=1 Tax=Fusarium oxysporum f. sp. rapae TaxID=485398 RepID=A0A8J5NQL0_FUSOX|nr:hypothetical protein Forpe1208_v010999 [Fusarium oxysporum f. sp. rapae]
MSALQRRYTRASKSPSVLDSAYETYSLKSHHSDDADLRPSPEQDVNVDEPECVLFEVVAGLTPDAFQNIRLYFHRLRITSR